jgi:hypothetical protein
MARSSQHRVSDRPRARSALRLTRQTVFGRQPALSTVVIAAAICTGVLQSAGVDGWWGLPLLVIVLLCAGVSARRRL